MRHSIAITFVFLALTAALVACGEDKPALCSSVDSLNQSMASMKQIPLYAASAPSNLQRELPAIASELANVKAEEKSEFSSQIGAAVSSYAALRTSVATAKTNASPDTLAATGNALSTFETDVARLITGIESTCRSRSAWPYW